MDREESYLYSLKDLFGHLYGFNEWYKFKHNTSIIDWKNEFIKSYQITLQNRQIMLK